MKTHKEAFGGSESLNAMDGGGNKGLEKMVRREIADQVSQVLRGME